MRTVLGMLLAACLWLVADVSVLAFAEMTHEGKVVSVTAGTAGEDGKLVMTDNAGAKHTHAISSTVKVTLNAKAAKLTDLKKGDNIRVTTDDAKKVTAVAATRDGA